jgi:TPR repeat protein
MRAASKAKKKDGWKGALVYLEIGCKANAAEACGVMGKILSRGKGVKKEVKRGKALMEKGCNLGDAMSCASPCMTLVFDHIFTISEHPPRKVICFQLERKTNIPKTLQGESKCLKTKTSFVSKMNLLALNLAIVAVN